MELAGSTYPILELSFTAILVTKKYDCLPITLAIYRLKVLYADFKDSIFFYR